MYQLDLRGLGACHPMFLVRMRTFTEWQQREGSRMEVLLPTDRAVCAHLAAMRVFEGIDIRMDRALGNSDESGGPILPVRTVSDPAGVEALADAALVSLEHGPVQFEGWQAAMAIAELGDKCHLPRSQ